MRAEDNPLGVYFLKAGVVKMYSVSEKGEEIILNVYKPISFFPMTWALNNTQNTYYYEAITDVEVWRAPKEESIIFIKENPDVLFNLVSRTYCGIDGMLQRMNYLMSGRAFARLLNELFIQAKRFGTLNSNGAVELKVSEKEIAAATGMTRETVSRQMRVLKEMGLLTLEHGVVCIPDLGKLEDELAIAL